MTFGIPRPDFPDGCAVIFGGSGGLGSAIAGLIAERGSKVVITYNTDVNRADEVVQQIEDARGIGKAMQCDITDRASVHTVIDESTREFGRIHTVIASHGRAFSAGPVMSVPMDDLKAQLEIDIIGFVNIVQASVPHLRRCGGGSITAILAAAVNRNVINNGLRIASKTAVASLIRSLATEEGPHGIRVNGVGPGVINAGVALKLSKGVAGDVINTAIRQSVLGRMGEAGEIAELAAFLASAKAGYTTGQLVISDGGFSL